MKELEFRVVGLPAPQGSKTLTRYGGLMESSKRVKPWRQDIIHAALEAFAGNPFNEPVQVSIEFAMELGRMKAIDKDREDLDSLFSEAYLKFINTYRKAYK